MIKPVKKEEACYVYSELCQCWPLVLILLCVWVRGPDHATAATVVSHYSDLKDSCNSKAVSAARCQRVSFHNQWGEPFSKLFLL